MRTCFLWERKKEVCEICTKELITPPLTSLLQGLHLRPFWCHGEAALRHRSQKQSPALDHAGVGGSWGRPPHVGVPLRTQIISTDGCFVVWQERGWRFCWDSFLLISPLPVPVFFFGCLFFCFFFWWWGWLFLKDGFYLWDSCRPLTPTAKPTWIGKGPPGSLPDAHLER